MTLPKPLLVRPVLVIVVAAAALTHLACPAQARDWPKPTANVNDLASALDAASRDSMETLAREVREKIGPQIAVLVVPDLGGENVDAAAEEVYRQWGVGRAGKDDGVLLLLAVAERRVRIEVGYGLEGILPDGRVGSIIRNVMGPDLSANRFGPGLLRGVEAVARIIADDAGVTLSREVGGEASPKPASPLGLILLALFFMIVMSAIASRRRRTRGWGDWRTRRRRGWYDPWGGFGGGLGGLGGFGGFGGGGGLGGGGGGGFGGFGGGRSGGGGASGGF